MDYQKTIRTDPAEIENVIIGLFATIYSRTTEDVEKSFGEKGREVMRKAFLDSVLESCQQSYKNMPSRELETYVRWLLSGLSQGHRFEVVENTPRSVKFRFTECPWATFFRAVGRPDIGFYFCETDEPMVKAFNPNIQFRRTKTLMEGHDCCDHHFFTDNIPSGDRVQ